MPAMLHGNKKKKVDPVLLPFTALDVLSEALYSSSCMGPINPTYLFF